MKEHLVSDLIRVKEQTSNVSVFAFRGDDDGRISVNVYAEAGIGSATIHMTPDELRELAGACERVAAAIERGQS